MNALVTGAEGFVGGHLIPTLLSLGWDVTATRLEPTGSDAPDGVRYVRLDVLDARAARDAIAEARPDVVFHLAGFSSGAQAHHRPAEALRVNAEGTLSMVEGVAAEAPSAVVVVTGSADIYGDPGSADVDETSPVRPVSAYGVSKAAQELVALGVARSRELDVRVARMFPLVGVGQAPTFVVPSFSGQAADIVAGRAEPMLRVGNLDVERDFLNVSDGVAALVAIAGLEAPRFAAYNVCSGTGTTIRQVLDWVLEAAGIDPEIVVDPARVRAADPPRIVGSARRLRDETAWRPDGDVREGVQGVYSWVQRSGDVHHNGTGDGG